MENLETNAKGRQEVQMVRFWQNLNILLSKENKLISFLFNLPDDAKNSSWGVSGKMRETWVMRLRALAIYKKFTAFCSNLKTSKQES